jgi:hypothetical protein
VCVNVFECVCRCCCLMCVWLVSSKPAAAASLTIDSPRNMAHTYLHSTTGAGEPAGGDADDRARLGPGLRCVKKIIESSTVCI